MLENDRTPQDSDERDVWDAPGVAVELPAARSSAPRPHEWPASTQVVPYILEDLTSKSLHFSISETQSQMRLDDPFALDLEYTRTMMGFLLFVPRPRRITMIGLGGGSLAKFCHRHVARALIDVIEINPHVVALRDEFHVPPDDERFRVIADDGARHVRGRRDECDVLIVDGFDSRGQPARLCSSRFYDDARAMLAPGGVMVANLHAGHRQHEVHVARIRRSFGPTVLAIDVDGGNRIVFAGKGPSLVALPADDGCRAAGLGRAARRQLLGAFEQIAAARTQPAPCP